MKSRLFLWLILAVLIAGLFESYCLDLSRHIGRLSSITNYDDVVYLNYASQGYTTLKDQGAPHFISWLFSGDIHAPFPVLSGIVGFFLFGTNVDRVYFMLFVVVFTYLIFVIALARNLPPILIASLLLSALALPFITVGALEFRPDLMWAILLGGGSVLFLKSENSFASWKHSLWYGVIFGLTLLVKPSTFAMTVLVMGGTWVLVVFRALLCKQASFSSAAVSLGVIILSTLLITGWYYIPNMTNVYNYFYQNSFGENKDIWSYKGTTEGRLTYYLRDRALYSNLGLFIFPLSLFAIGGPALEIFRRKELFNKIRGASFLWMLLGTFSVNAAFEMKSPFLGGSFYAFLIFSGLWYFCEAICYIIHNSRLQSYPSQALAGCLIVAGAWEIHNFPPVSRLNPKSRLVQKAVNTEFLNTLLANASNKPSKILLTQGNPVVGEYLQMQMRMSGKELDLESATFCKSLNAVLSLAAKCDYVTVQDNGIEGSPGHVFPCDRLQPTLIKNFYNDSKWKLIFQYKSPGGESVYLFKQLSSP